MKREEEVKLENYSKQVIFTYSTKHLAKKDKVRFYYALKGRDGKSGIIKQYNIEQLGRTVLLSSAGFEREIEQFLQHWKCQYNKKKVLIQNE